MHFHEISRDPGLIGYATGSRRKARDRKNLSWLGCNRIENQTALQKYCSDLAEFHNHERLEENYI